MPARADRPDRGEETLSLYHLLDPEVLADPYPLYRELRELDPVHWDPYLHAWVVTRYEDVVSVLTHCSASRAPTPEYFEALGAPDVSPIARVMVRQMLFRDPPDHTRLRKLAGAGFLPMRVEALRAHIGTIASELIDRIAERGHGQLELLEEFAAPFPAMVTAELLGLPARDHAQLKAWSASFAEMLGNFQHNPDRLPGVAEALEAMTAYFTQALAEQRLTPRPGLIQALLTNEDAGDRLGDDEIVANCIVTLVGGLETTTNLLGNGMLTLLRHPALLARLRATPALIPAAVEELLRYESPSQHTARLAPAAFTLGGKTIAPRQAIIAVMAAGNRDPARFAEPDRVDIERPDNRHLAFGWGAHFCFGAPLARLEARLAFEALLTRFPTLALTDEPLAWRANLGLRGLQALPLTFDT